MSRVQWKQLHEYEFIDEVEIADNYYYNIHNNTITLKATWNKKVQQLSYKKLISYNKIYFVLFLYNPNPKYNIPINF